MSVTTLGRLIVRDALPLKYKKYALGELNKSTITKLTTLLAKLNPLQYIDILQNLNNIGLRVVSTYGKDTTITLDDIDAGALVKNARKRLLLIIRTIINNPKLTLTLKLTKIIDLGYKYTQKLRLLGVLDAKRRKTGIANQIASGSRGNAVQLMQLITGDMMMKDAMNRDIPYIALMPYADGDSPMSYYASAMSNRKSTYDVQAATGQVGYLSKQAANITHATPISTFDCGTTKTGIKVKAADTLNVGAILLRPFKNHKAGSIVTLDMLALAGDDDFMFIRSATTCKAHNGVCALCSGLQLSGQLPAVGSYVALNAAKSFTEPLTQAGISCLHPGTPVRMADWSVKPIRDIKVGDMVMGVSKLGIMLPTRVVNIFDNGTQPVYLFKYRSGYCKKRFVSLACTLLHKVLQATNKSSCKLLILNNKPRILKAGYIGKRVSAYLAAGSKHIDGKLLPLALLLGLLLGDGCYTKGIKYLVCFSCADPSLIGDLKDYMDSFNLLFNLCAGHDIYYRVSKKDHKNNGVSVIKQRLIDYGMLGKYAHLKLLPADVFSWSSDSVALLIAGLLITDGSIYKAKKAKRQFISFASTSIKLVKGVKDLLLKHCAAHGYIRVDCAGGRKLPLYSVVYNKASLTRKIAKFVKLYGVKLASRLLLLRDTLNLQNHLAIYTNKRLLKTFLGMMPTIDILVEHPDHLFLLGNSLVVSNSKHGSGVGGVKLIDPEGEDQPTGFASVLRMFNAPATFPGGAVLSLVSGRVNAIKLAPQGGHYITVGTNTMYASTARTVTVKPGDVVLVGDMLTNGVPNPALVVQYKGIGQGRQYFTKKMSLLLKKTGAGTHRRNVEQFSRAFLNKVKITKDLGFKGYYPGDIANYDDVVLNWLPRLDSKLIQLDKAVGSYLLLPIMHYTIGTKVTPAVVKALKLADITSGLVNSLPPPFLPVFVRSKQFTLHDKNWLPRLAGLRLKLGLFDAARSGLIDLYDSPSYINRVISHQYKPTN